jgi:hypothetical protein
MGANAIASIATTRHLFAATAEFLIEGSPILLTGAAILASP